MAEKLGLEIDTTGGASIDKATTSVKQLKAAMKEAQNAALNGDGNAARRVAELRDQMDDLRDATQTMQGSGVEKAKTSLSMLGEGFKNLDFDKIKTAFKGLGAAMKAIPIFLIIEGIKYLVENFDSLSKGSGPLAKILRAVGDALHWIGDIIGSVINYFTDMAGVTSDATRALEKQGEAIKTNAEKTNAALQSQIKKFDEQIAVAKAAGKNTVDLEKAKQEAIVQTNLTIARQIEAFVRAGGELDDEKKKLLTASLDAIRAAKVQEKVIEITDQKQKIADYKKHNDEKIAESKRVADELYAELTKNEDAITASEMERRAKEKAAREKAAKEAEDLAKANEAFMDAYYQREAARIDGDIKKKAEAEKEIAAIQQDTRGKSFQAAHALSDLYYQIQGNKAKGNAAQELALAKQKFNVDKAFNVAQGIMEGTRATLGTLAATAKYGPLISIPATIAAGVLAAANVAKILATKFDGGGSGGGSLAPVLPTGSGQVPEINNAANTPIQKTGTTNLDENGRNLSLNVHATVSEEQVSSVQDRIKRLKEQAKF